MTRSPDVDGELPAEDYARALIALARSRSDAETAVLTRLGIGAEAFRRAEARWAPQLADAFERRRGVFAMKFAQALGQALLSDPPAVLRPTTLAKVEAPSFLIAQRRPPPEPSLGWQAFAELTSLLAAFPSHRAWVLARFEVRSEADLTAHSAPFEEALRCDPALADGFRSHVAARREALLATGSAATRDSDTGEQATLEIDPELLRRALTPFREAQPGGALASDPPRGPPGFVPDGETLLPVGAPKPALPFPDALDLEGYAELSAELAMAGPRRAEVLRRRGLTEATWAAEAQAWERRLEADPEARRRAKTLLLGWRPR